MKIAIVNDMLMAVEALRRVLATVPEYELVWVARDGAEAVAKSRAQTPDLILMDLLMPVMDGVEATRQIMTYSPCAIVVVTASVNRYASKVFEAMGYGALDAVCTPIFGLSGNTEGAAGLLAKIAIIGKLLGKSAGQKHRSISPAKQFRLPNQTLPLVAIGASTGGPQALATILSQLPESFSAAIVIIQHVDVQFALSLVKWLNPQTPLTVELANLGCQLAAGKVLIAGTNDHLVWGANGTLMYTKEPRDYSYRPSVDVFFKSCAQHWPGKGVGVLLTGMGKDGAAGLMSLRSAGWHTIAQD
jgi:two-component system response regulator WspF